MPCKSGCTYAQNAITEHYICDTGRKRCLQSCYRTNNCQHPNVPYCSRFTTTQDCSRQIKLVQVTKYVNLRSPIYTSATMAWISCRKCYGHSLLGLQQHLHSPVTYSAPHSSQLHPTQIGDQNLRESKTKCAASRAASSDESTLCFAWQFLFNFGETRTPVVTQALRVQHK